MKLDTFMSQMWKDYCEMNPEAPKIYDLLSSNGETILNDHIALRTFRHPKLGLASAIRQFEKLGYKLAEQEYVFKQKKLFAKHMLHPDPQYPKVFISELELEKMSPFVIETLTKLAEQIPDGAPETPEFYFSGRPWILSHATYEKLAAESEYASWVAAFGFRPNHFTVNVNELRKYNNLVELNALLKAQGFKLNQSGGEIKGSQAQYLEQSSTMAPLVSVKFSDGVFPVPGCYYEFAKRYALPSGELYTGFVAESADKIFESTNKAR